MLPDEFTIQLYNPDQQVVVHQKPGGWGGTPSYTFSMPQQTFRLPSSSALDRQLSDPAADITTPQITFHWKREGKLSKDLACYMTGKSTDPVKKKSKEPDIMVSMYQGLREITIYESNYHRIDMEDPKGLEVVILLSAAVLKEVYFAPLKEAFNVGESGSPALRKHSSSLTLLGNGNHRKNNASSHNLAMPPPVSTSTPPMPSYGPPPPASFAAPGGRYAQPQHRPDPRQPQAYLRPPPAGPRTSSAPASSSVRPPPADPRSQWEIDAETARLKAEQDAERARLQASRREQEKADAAEAKRLKKQMEWEEKERRRKQAEIDKETERLRRKYGTQGQELAAPQMPPRPHHVPQQPQPRPQQQQHPAYPPRPQPQAWHPGPYLGPPTMAGGAGPGAGPHGHGHGHAASMHNLLGSNGLPIRNGLMKQKKSFWNLGGGSRDMGVDRNVARRKSSVMF